MESVGEPFISAVEKGPDPHGVVRLPHLRHDDLKSKQLSVSPGKFQEPVAYRVSALPPRS